MGNKSSVEIHPEERRLTSLEGNGDLASLMGFDQLGDV
ncbi:unannotated protein [freshwater metagenome]|uniref:Unannotated protein n=1 Tax=freshwater metagenome TaxID=449393 RepID=A0A6J6G8J2_9ZZZZ